MTIDIVEVVSVLLWRPRTQRSVEPLLTVRGIFMYAQSACVNCNDGNQISLPQQRSMRPREKFEIKGRAGSKDYSLVLGMVNAVARLLKKKKLWLYGNLYSELLVVKENEREKRINSLIERKLAHNFLLCLAKVTR
ncbi:hypothetical protein ACS0PU_009965 [Formica fusca]